MVKSLIVSVLSIIACVSCETYDFDGMLKADSSVKERFRNSMSENQKNFYPSKLFLADDSYSFAVATDMHIKDNDWLLVEKFVASIESSNNRAMVLLGDYMYIAGTSLDKLAKVFANHEKLKIFPAIGNHEIYKKGYQNTYSSVFGPTCYYFKIVTTNHVDLFIILDSANGTLGREQYQWLQHILLKERVDCRHCFVFTHANFFNPPGYFDIVSSYPVEELMKLLNMFSENNITAVFSGHSHYYDKTTVDKVQYITLDDWQKGKCNGEYCIVNCKSNGNWDSDILHLW